MYVYIYIYIYMYIHVHNPPGSPRILASGAEAPRRSQRHINGVVSKNKSYNMFGFGGIKRPF